jgi:PKD repeat protein
MAHKPTLSFLIAILLFLTSQLQGQRICSSPNNGTLFPSTSWQTVSACSGGYYAFQAQAGCSYTFSHCQGGGSYSGDTYLTITSSPTTGTMTWNDDWCGLGSNLSWTANSTGTFYIHLGNFSGGCGGPCRVLAYTSSCNSGPAAPTSIQANPAQVCQGQTTTLTAQGVSGTVYWYSNSCGSGLLGTGNSIQVTVNGPTTVYARNYNNNQFSTTCASISLSPQAPPAAPVISINGSNFICTGDSVMLTSNYPTGNTWSTGGTGNTIYVSTPTTVTATYTDPNGCVSAASNSISTNLLPQPPAPTITALTPTTGCTYDTIVLQANQPNNITWSNGFQGQTLQTNINGNYSAQFTDNNGCLSQPSNSISATVNPAPNIQLPPNLTSCEGSFTAFNTTVQLSNTNNPSIAQTLWTYGDGNQSNVLQQPYAYGQPGTYTAQLVVQTNHGCSDTAQTSVTVNPKPVINSTTNSPVCQGQSMSFSQNSQVANINNASIQTYTWHFGDNSQGSGSSINHSYSQPGNYQGNLIITTNHGCRDTAFMNLLVHPNPAIQSPTVSSGCQGAATAFGAQVSISNVNNASIIAETWNTGDGNTANGANTSHTYAQPGTYNAQLIVSSNHGCVDSAQVSAVVNPTPQLVQSSFPDVCLGQLSQFSQSTTLANVNNAQITGFAWDFGNGNQSNSLNPTQLYAQTGSYIVQLTVQTNQNCPMVVTDTVLVNPYPVIASINANDVCLGNASNFSQSSSVSNTNGSTINQYLWSFGNGNTSANPSPAYTYPNAGSYNAQLMVTTNFGCSDTLQTNVLVNPNPILSNLSLSDVCMGNATGLNAGVSIPNINGASIASQNWDMGDGTQLSGSNISHNYLNPGLFVVQGTISSNQGCALQVTDTALVFPNPTASLASANTVCEETATSFNGNASISAVNGAAIAAYQWDFGDGNAANGQNPSHNYATWGNYNFHMVVSSNHGCLDTLFGNATVHPKPVAQFDLPGHCGGSPMPLTDFSSIPAGSIDSYLWTSSDGLNSGQQNPVWTLAQGQQQVTLLLTSDQGCTDTLSKSIAVGQPFNTSFAPTLIGTATVQFLPDTLDPYLNYMWDFGDGTVSYQINPQHTYWNSGIYTVCLTISDSLCSSSYCTDMQLNATGVETLEAQLMEIKVGPNPFNDQLFIQLPEYNGNWSVSLRDAQGRLIGQKTTAQNQLLWNGLEHLSSGIYLLQVETREGTRFVKVLK